MSRVRFLALTMATIALSLALAPTVQSQTPAKPAADADTCVNKVYSLAEFGQDANLCQWIAETIPVTVKPQCWAHHATGATGTLSYFAPGKVLVIHQTPEVHAQIDEFLKNLKKAMPQEKAMPVTSAAHLVPVQFTPPSAPPIAPPMPAPIAPTYGYPVPQVQQTPKHLFHFIIRYEGEGIIDSNVVKFAKALQDKVGVNTPYTCPTPVPSAPVPAPPVGSPLSYSNSSSSGWVKVEEMPTSSHRPRMPTADEPGRVAPMPMLPSVPAPAPYPPPPPPVVRN